MTISNDLMTNPECMCCPTMDICTTECGVTIVITKDIIQRSNCNGRFTDAFEDVP